MSYTSPRTSNKSKPRLLLFIFLPITFAVALFFLSGPVDSFARTGPATPVSEADTVVATNAIVVEDRVRLAVTVTNDGPGDEPKLISVVNTFPEGTSFASFSGENWICDHDERTRTSDCKFDAPLSSGERTELVLLADKETDVLDSYLNTTAAIGTLRDPVLENNSVVTELFYLGRDVENGVEIGSDPAPERDSGNITDRASEDVPINESEPIGNDRMTDDGTTAQYNKSEPILPKTGTNLTALLVAVGTAMAIAGRWMVSRSEQSKMLAYALNR